MNSARELIAESYADKVRKLVEEFKQGRYLMWRDCGEGRLKTYSHLVDADFPGVGYFDDGCRACPTKLAEVAEDLVTRLARKLEEAENDLEEARKNEQSLLHSNAKHLQKINELEVRLDELRNYHQISKR